LYKGAGLFPDYQTEVDRRFVTAPLIQFVQKLRHFAQHFRLPHISYKLEAGRDSGITRRLVLDKSDLLQFDGWTAPAQKYLASAPEQIDLLGVVQEYGNEVRAFCRWMEERQREIHTADATAVEERQAEGRALLAREIPGTLESGLKIWTQGVGSLQDVFAFAFSPDDWVTLSKHEGDLVAWTDAALSLTEERFGSLPAELVARIREAARGGK
jgi:hypothetical protein